MMRVALSILILQFTLLTNMAWGQDDGFKMIADSETVHLYLDFGGNSVGIRMLNLPEEVIGSGLVVNNINNTCFGSKKIEGSQFVMELRGNYSMADTFLVYLVSYGIELLYPAEVFQLKNSTNQIALGTNCYKLNCVPKNDPWMPTAYHPFLFPKNGFYINPKNGKIMKGKRLINSGNYSICELKNWKYISPYGLYLDKKGNKHRGSDLINKGKIKLIDWNLEAFSLHWYL